MTPLRVRSRVGLEKFLQSICQVGKFRANITFDVRAQYGREAFDNE